MKNSTISPALTLLIFYKQIELIKQKNKSFVCQKYQLQFCECSSTEVNADEL